jgi:hypothetical protein
MKTILLVILSVLFMTSCKKENLSPLNGEYTLFVMNEYGNYDVDTLTGKKMIFDNTDVCTWVYKKHVNSITYGDTTIEVHEKLVWRLNGNTIQFKSRRGESWKYSHSEYISIFNGEFVLGENNTVSIYKRV